MEDTEGEDWFGKWQNRVLQSLDDALQAKNREGPFSIYSLMITDEDNINCKREQENMEELADALQHQRGDSLSFSVSPCLVCVQDLTTAVRTMTDRFLAFVAEPAGAQTPNLKSSEGSTCNGMHSSCSRMTDAQVVYTERTGVPDAINFSSQS